MRSRFSRRGAVLALASLLTLAAAMPAAAVNVRGHQVAVNEPAGKFKMNGDLIGKWKITHAKVLSEKPIFRIKGKEKFKGCLDLSGDRSCDAEPAGVMYFSFRYWASFNDDGSLNLGACTHPVTGGKGAFAGATGFLGMVDTPTDRRPGFKTRYEGVIDLAGTAKPPAYEPFHC